MFLRRHLTKNTQSRRFTVMSDHHGWEVTDEEGSMLLRRSLRQDWHRVERDMWLFHLEALAMMRAGWVESGTPAAASTAADAGRLSSTQSRHLVTTG